MDGIYVHCRCMISTGLLLKWSGWNMGTGSDELPLNWFDLIDE